MPRIPATSQPPGYIAGGPDNRYGQSSTSTTTSTLMNRPKVEQAPSSANSLPWINSAARSPAIPAPSSLMTTTSLTFQNRPTSSYMNGGRLSPRRTAQKLSVNAAELPTVQSDIAPRKPNRNILKAAEAGKGTLLPDFTHSRNTSTGSTSNGSAVGGSSGMRNREPPNRQKTRSSPSLNKVMGLGGGFKQRQQSGSSAELPQTQQDVSGSSTQHPFHLRRRTYSTNQSDDEDLRRYSDSPYRSHRSGRRGGWSYWLQQFSRMKLGHILQIGIVLSVAVLVWESHNRALFAANQISLYQDEQSLLLLHLQKLEQQSIQLHENLSRLAESGIKTGVTPDKKAGGGGDVDFDLIHKQTQQLYQMEEELNQEVHTLQNKIQQSARNHIVAEYGEGPVQVVLELDFGDQKQEGPSRVSILLWHETPHAAWTWLEQIGRNIWTGAKFEWQHGNIIDAIPIAADPQGSKVEFLEQSHHSHERWSVGLRETEEGVMTMYINLEDNSSVHRHETCVGKINDGFDAVQRLLVASRDGDSGNVITIKNAYATHVTKKEHA